MPSPSLADALDAASFVSLTVCRSGAEWQASLEVESGAFRIRVGRTPSLALEALFEPVPAFAPSLPPLPY